METTGKRIYFNNLDILRFMAAYMVVLLHAFYGWKTHFKGIKALNGFAADSQALIERVFANFSIGVDVFFLISGFLLTYLLLAEREKNGKVDVLRFYIRRAFRIWPLYFFMLLLGPLLTYFFKEQEPGYLYHFFFAGNFDLIKNGTKSIATDHLWSICIEEHYYLICPLLIGFVPLKRLPETMLFICFLSFIFRANVSLQNPDVSNIIYLHTLSRIDVLAIGSLFGYLFYNKKLVFNHSLPTRLMIYATFLVLFVNVNYGQDDNFFYATFKKYVFVFALAYWMGNFLFHPKALFAVKKTNIFHSLGKVTYGLYMFNPVVIYLILKAFSAYQTESFLFFVALFHVLLAGICFLSYRFFEMPFLKLKEKYAVIKSGGLGATEPEAVEVPAAVEEPTPVEEPPTVALSAQTEPVLEVTSLEVDSLEPEVVPEPVLIPKSKG